MSLKMFCKAEFPTEQESSSSFCREHYLQLDLYRNLIRTVIVRLKRASRSLTEALLIIPELLEDLRSAFHRISLLFFSLHLKSRAPSFTFQKFLHIYISSYLYFTCLSHLQLHHNVITLTRYLSFSKVIMPFTPSILFSSPSDSLGIGGVHFPFKWLFRTP